MKNKRTFVPRASGTHFDLVVRLAVRLLPPHQRDRRAEEWKGDIQAAAEEDLSCRDVAVGAVKTAVQARLREEIRQSSALRTLKIVSLLILGLLMAWLLILDFRYSLYPVLISMAVIVALFAGYRIISKRPADRHLARMATATVLLHGVSAAAMVYLTSWRIPESFTSLAQITQYRDQWIWEPTWSDVVASFLYPASPYPLGTGMAVHPDDAVLGVIYWFGAWGAIISGIVTCVILLCSVTRRIFTASKMLETSKSTA